MNNGRIDQEFDRMVRNGSNAKRGMLNCRLSKSISKHDDTDIYRSSRETFLNFMNLSFLF